MLALKYLFEATGNFTYMNTINQMINSIITNFRDPTDGVYYKEVDPAINGNSNGTMNTNKNFGTEAYLFRALRRVSTLSEEMNCNITTNATDIQGDFIKDDDIAVNISANAQFSFNQYPNTNNYLNSPFPNATFFFVVRYPNNTQIATQTQTGNVNGNANFTFNLTPNLPIGVYNISMRINYTGFLAVFNSTTFNLISGMQVLNYTMNSQCYAGDVENLSLTLNSSRAENTSFAVSLSSETIYNVTFHHNHLLH